MQRQVEFVPGGFLPPPERAPYRAANHLRKMGHRVEEQDIPGLWRINGGAEITSGQLVQIAIEVG